MCNLFTLRNTAEKKLQLVVVVNTCNLNAGEDEAG
jgi:hypothetical protein